MSQNPFYAFPELARPFFLRFHTEFSRIWAGMQQEGDWINTPGLIWPNTLPYGAAKAVLSIPTALVTFVKEQGDTTFADLSSKQREYTWDDKFVLAVSEKAEKIASDSFNGWPMLPQKVATERMDLWLEGAAACLDGSQTGWDGVALFSTSHKCNLVNSDAGTYSNLIGSMAFSASNLQTAIDTFKKRKNMKGKQRGKAPTAIIGGIDVIETIKDLVLLERRSTSGDTTTDKFRGRFKQVIEIPQLTTGTDWFLADFSDPLMAPLVRSMGNGGNLEVIAHGEQSPMYYKNQSLGLEEKERINWAPGLFFDIMKFKVAA